MNKGNAKDYLPLVQALADGKTLQMKNGDKGWSDLDMGINIYLDADSCKYRIKPEPFECWMNIYPDGYIYSYTSKKKARDFFSDDGGRCAVHMREVEDEEG